MSIVLNNLVGYWHYGKGVTDNTWENIAPSTRGNYNGQIVNAVLQNDGVYFNGVDSRVIISTPQELQTLGNPYTIEILFTGEDLDNSRMLFGGETFASIDLYGVWFEHFIGDTWEDSVGHWTPYDLSGNNLVHFAVVYDPAASEVRYYFDGNLINTESVSEPLKWVYGTGQVSIGYEAFGDEAFKGYIHAVRIYNRSLTSQEIQQNYDTGIEIGIPEVVIEAESETQSYSMAQLRVTHKLNVASITSASSDVSIGVMRTLPLLTSTVQSSSSVDLKVTRILIPLPSVTSSYSSAAIRINHYITAETITSSSSLARINLINKLNILSITTTSTIADVKKPIKLDPVVSITTSTSSVKAYTEVGYGILLEEASGSRAAEILTLPAEVLNVEKGTVEIEVVVNDALLNSTKAMLFSASDNNGNNYFQLYYEPDRWVFQIRSSSTIRDIAVSNDLPNDVHIFAITWSNHEAALFINGEKKNSTSSPPIPSSITQVGIGHWVLNGSQQLNSAVANLRISNKALMENDLLHTVKHGFKMDEFTTAFMDFEQNINYTSPVNVSDRAVLKDELYNGISISESDGFLAVRSDEKVMTVINATSGFAIQTRPNTSSPWNAKLYADTNGNLYLDGTLVAAKGSFTGTLQAATGTFAGTLQAANGTFTGTLQAANGTFTGNLIAAGGTFAGTLQAVDGVFTGRLSAVNGTFTGELIGASGTFTGDLIGGRILSNTVINVGTDLRVGNNIYLGSLTDFSVKSIYFNNAARIVGGTGFLAAGISISASELYLTDMSRIVFGGQQVEYSSYSNDRCFLSHVAETGWCGIGAVTDPSLGTTNQAIVGVNFRIRKTYTPSSISLSATSSNTSAGVSDISSNGFSLYIQKGPAYNFYYWRGRYTA